MGAVYLTYKAKSLFCVKLHKRNTDDEAPLFPTLSPSSSIWR